MRSSLIAAIVALGATAYAQSLSGLPQCAQTCVGTGLASTGCNAIDIGCICKSKTWISTLSCCVSKSCSAADQEATIKFADQLCATNGVTNLPTVAGCAATAGSSSAAAAGPTGSSSSASASMSMTMSGNSTMTSMMSSATGAMASGSAAAANGTSSAASSSSSSGAGSNNQMGLGFAVAGLVAALL